MGTIKHKRQSNRPNNSDPGDIQPQDWNDAHDIDGYLGTLLPLDALPGTFPYIGADNLGAAGAISSLALAFLAGANSAVMRDAIGALGADSPALTGTPTAPTASISTNTDQIATMRALRAMRDDLVNGAPGALDALNELAAAIGNDPNFAATMSAALGNRLRFDAAQSLTGPQKTQAIANLALAAVAASGAYADLSGKPSLGSAAALNVGTAASQVVQLDGSARLPAVDGSQLTNISNTVRAIRIRTFVSSATYTPHANLLYGIAEGRGGGGAGGGISGGASKGLGGGGGGEGGRSRKVFTAADIGASKPVVIGAGGAPVDAGSGGNGGDTSLGALLVAKGGAGGSANDNSFAYGQAGPGGVAGTGDVLETGQPGGQGASSASSGLLVVAGAPGGGSGGGRSSFTGLTASPGYDALGFGGGGSGACVMNSSGTAAGGAGKAGHLFIIEFCSA